MLQKRLFLLAVYFIPDSSAFVTFDTFGNSQGEKTRVSRRFAGHDQGTVLELSEAFSKRQRTNDAAVQTTPVSPIQSSVTTPVVAGAASRQWEQLAPRLWQKEQTVDVRLTWVANATDSSCSCSPQAHMARQFLDEIQSQLGTRQLLDRTKMEHELQAWMESFVGYCQQSLKPSVWNGGVTARIVSSRGPASTKCPRWHLDHVPFRWIHALVGPGCQWVDVESSSNDDGGEASQALLAAFLQDDDNDDEGEDEAENNVDSVSTDNVNGSRLDPLANAKNLRIVQARPGEAVLLLGKEWTSSSNAQGSLNPVIHKSPADIPPWQGRVLLTMDIVPVADDG